MRLFLPKNLLPVAFSLFLSTYLEENKESSPKGQKAYILLGLPGGRIFRRIFLPSAKPLEVSGLNKSMAPTVPQTFSNCALKTGSDFPLFSRLTPHFSRPPPDHRSDQSNAFPCCCLRENHFSLLFHPPEK